MEKTTKRVTKAQRFEDIKALLNGSPVQHETSLEEALSFIDNELELLARKNASGEKKPSAVQIANEQYKERIVEFLATQENGVTCTEIMKGVTELAEFNNQKIARLVRDLCEVGRVTKAVVKGKSIFSLA